MIITVQHRTWEVHITPADPAKARNGVYVEVRHKPKFGEPVVPWSGNRFGLLEAEAYRIAQALIEATNGERERSLKVVESFRSNTKKPVEAARRGQNPSKSGSTSRFTPTQGRYLAFIHRYMTKYGVAPAEADIQRHFLVSAPSVNAMMQTLTRRRLISRVPGVARSIRLLVPPEELRQS
jgi:hypothetical protein